MSLLQKLISTASWFSCGTLFQFSQLLQLLISACLIKEVANDQTLFAVSPTVENVL